MSALSSASRPFVHLHCHSHYSLLDGASQVPALIARAKSQGMNALAITDHGNMHAAMEFLREAKNADFHAIVGLEAYVAPGHRASKVGGGVSGQEHNFHLTLLARNAEGFRNLVRLSSKAWLEGFYYKPRIDKEILERHSEGLICLSGCASAEFSDLLLHDKFDAARDLCAWYQKVFGEENFYVEIQNNGVKIQRECEERALDVANRMGLPVVATSDAHYLTREDSAAHDVLLCINTGKTFDDPTRMRFDTDEFHVRSPEEMYAAMPGREEALKTSVKIAEMVDYSRLDLGRRRFPVFKPPAAKSPEDYLRELCETGLRERYGPQPPPAAVERLEHELGIIIRMGFASYFLIVWDFVRFARERGIPNSARGSACGALVSYVLHLSHVDPLAYDLLFERFLDPNRSEAPDIDIDLCQDRRYEVIEYVRNKYGAENVAQIGTFGTLAARAVLRDVGRVLGIPLSKVDQVAKLVPQVLNISLKEALRQEPELRRLSEQDPDVSRMLDYGQRLEGLVRNVGTHAAGVVIADQPLMELVPLQKLPNKDKDKEVVTTQWDMGDVEKAGLLKMDFLGLRNLTILQRAVKLINERYPDSPVDIAALPLDDPATYALLQRGETKGVFQLESPGIRDLLAKMRPDVFNDIIATNALYRPGPLKGGMVDDYIDCKHGRKSPSYPHPVMREILEETHGVMVYQEQVMRILNRLGGIELSAAYQCIKAISKKKTETIAKNKAQFVEGAVARGLAKDKAVEIFDLIEFFGGYGFNKSHSTAYALVAYQTAYLKAHHPTEYMAALLSSEIDGAERDKLVEHIEDCRNMGIRVLPPDVNRGSSLFTVPADGEIHFGLSAIKGVGVKAVEALVAERDRNGPYRGLADLLERVPQTVLTPGTVEILIKAGALDEFGGNRARLLAALPRAALAAQQVVEDRRRGQRSLFEMMAADPAPSSHSGPRPADSDAAEFLPDVPELPDAEKLAEEKKALGFYMSSHPLARHESLVKALATHPVSALAAVPERQEVVLGGMISALQVKNVQKSRSGLSRMAKLTFEDLTGAVPAMLWPEAFAKLEPVLKPDAIGFVVGTMNRSRDPAEFVVSNFVPLERAAMSMSTGLFLTLRAGAQRVEDLDRLRRILSRRPGGLEVYFELFGVENVHRAVYKAGASSRVRLDPDMIPEIEAVLGRDSVRLLGRNNVPFTVDPDLVALMKSVAAESAPTPPAPGRSAAFAASSPRN